MGILRSGILGGVKNKIGGVVGYNSRGQDIIRSYAVPTNPNTTLQQGQRTLFQQVVLALSSCWVEDIKRIWDLIQSGKTVTGWSRAVKVNLDLQTSAGFDWTLFRPVTGNREHFNDVEAEYSSSGMTKVTFIYDTSGMSYKPEELVGAGLVIDKVRRLAWLGYITEWDPYNYFDVNILAGTPQANLECYAWCTNPLHTAASPAVHVPLTV